MEEGIPILSLINQTKFYQTADPITTNYNIGRNEVKIGNSESKTDKSEIIKNRNINRVYYNLKNGVRYNGETLTTDKRRDYLNRGELNLGGSSRSSATKNARSNFQQVKYSGKTRSYDKTRSSLNNSSSNLNRGRDYSRSELNNSRSSSNSRSSYSSPSGSYRSSSSSVKIKPKTIFRFCWKFAVKIK